MVLPVEEIIFDVGLMFTYGVKCRDQVAAVPAEISGELRDKIQAAALGPSSCWMQGYSKGRHTVV